MIRIFKNLEEYNTFTNNGQDLVSGDLYWVKENKRAFFLTNNIDGEVKSYDMFTGGIPEEYIIPSGNIAITENGEGIDVKNYATASVNVPIPDGYIVPSGTIEITENGEGIDVTNYATATVNVPSTGGGNEDLISFIQGDITTLNIPDGTTKIGDGVFKNYTRPKSVIIPNSVKSIGSSAFNGCSSLTDITIPDSVTNIGIYTFSGCSSLTDITIPDSVTNIDIYAFKDCKALTEVTIGNGVTNIGDAAFYNCSSLTSVTIKATTPPTLGSIAFSNGNNCPIYVPAASVDAYKTATNWSAYADKIQAIPTVIEENPSGGNPSGGPVIN